MAFVTSYEHRTPAGARVRVACCYNWAKAGDEPQISHTVHYASGVGLSPPHVTEIWAKHGWGKRGRDLPICPAHRREGDVDWPA